MIWKSMHNGYSVSEYGDIRNDRNNHILKPFLHVKGYLKLTLKGKKYFVHRLVAIQFVPNPFNKPQVNHIDGNKLNNHYTNFEWNTNQENNTHAFSIGLREMGENHIKAKLSTTEVIDIKSSTLKPKELAVMYNTPLITIYKIRQGKNRKLG